MDDEYDPESGGSPNPPWQPPGGRGGKNLRRKTKPLGPASQRLARRLNTRRRLLWASAASLALLAAAAIGFWWFTGTGPFQSQTPPITPPASLIELATEYPELAEILQDPKLDTAYKDFLVAYQSGGSESAIKLAQQRGLLNANGDLRLTLELDTTETAELQRELEENGIVVTAVSENLMDIAVPLGLMERLMAAGTADNLLGTITNLEHVVRIRLPQIDVHDQTGQATPEVSPTALAAPPAAPTEPPEVSIGPLQAPYKAFMAGLGVLLCVVAPLLLGLGMYLLYSGLGLTRRARGGEAPLAAPPGAAAPLPMPGGYASSGKQAAPAADPPAGFPPPQATQSGPGATPSSTITAKENPPPAPETSSFHPTTGGALPAAAAPLSSQQSAVGIVACSQCGQNNRSEARFCAHCGNLLGGGMPQTAVPPIEPSQPPETPVLVEHPTYCWNCGQRLRPTSLFCPYCGDRI